MLTAHEGGGLMGFFMCPHAVAWKNYKILLFMPWEFSVNTMKLTVLCYHIIIIITIAIIILNGSQTSVTVLQGFLGGCFPF